MAENSEEMYLQNIEEFVLDEDKIVTYKWLSKSLNIHVNKSKQLLYTFCKNKKDSVSATFLIAGKLRCNGECHMVVVGQDKYEETKSLFESFSSEHVYSVQKALQPPALSTLYSVDTQPVDEKDGGCFDSLGAIRCKESVRRAAEELALLRITVPPPQPTKAAPKQLKPSGASPSKEPKKASPLKSKTEDKKGNEPAAKDKAKGGLAAMFAAQTSKASKSSASSSSTTAKNNTASKKPGGISNFFSKVSKEEALQKNEKIVIKEASSDKSNSKETAKGEKASEEPRESSDGVSAKKANTAAVKLETKPSPDIKSKQQPKATTQNKKRRSKAQEKKDDGKKRKRIMQISDSSDDEIFDEEEKVSSREQSPVPVLQAKALESDEENDEDVIPPTPEAGSSTGRIRRKRKVIKDNTFMDGDGYVVTQKVTEYESYSESDNENQEPKKMKDSPASAVVSKESSASSSKSKDEKSKAPGSKKASPVNHKSPAKNKQQSLMNFFKKKD
ncbi:DNA polymerase delta subunit 3 [Frankliniella fusca]|uniref:DNA polymerase delta subunit 3 n=1 Tax=Frankliniella fusca TaxID=407009 RepID=A0AAE1HQR9_9NEOP|nr:DNA polymerase delta subunit 3 [Frankliniella fusca]